MSSNRALRWSMLIASESRRTPSVFRTKRQQTLGSAVARECESGRVESFGWKRLVSRRFRQTVEPLRWLV